MFLKLNSNNKTKKSKVRSVISWLTASKKRQRISTIVGILLIGLTGQIIYSSFAATTEYSQIPEVAKMQKLTEEVVAMADEYASMPDTVSTKKGAKQPNAQKESKKQELIAKVKERKDAYKVAMQYDPQAVADAYLKQYTIDKLTEEAKVNLEQPTALEGVWVRGSVENVALSSADTSTTKQSMNLVQVQLPDGSRIAVYGKTLPDYDTGAPVKLYGSRMGNSFVAALPSILSSTNIATQTQTQCPNQDQQSECVANVVKNLIDSINQLVLQAIAIERQDVINKGGSADQVVWCFAVQGISCDRDPNIPSTNASFGTRKLLTVSFSFPGQNAQQLRDRRIQDGHTPPSIQQLKDLTANTADFFKNESYTQFTPEISVFDQVIELRDNPTDGIDLNASLIQCNDIQNIVFNATAYTINTTPGLRELASGNNATDIIGSIDVIPCAVRDAGNNMTLSTPRWTGVQFSPSSPRFGDIIKGGMLMNWASGDIIGDGDVLAHEYSHALGVGHAGVACAPGDCWRGPGAADNEQFFMTYADPYNVMGSSYSDGGDWDIRDSKSINIVQKNKIGWVDKKDINCLNVGTPNNDGGGGIVSTTSNLRPSTYKLNALWQDNGVRGIKIDPSSSGSGCKSDNQMIFRDRDYAIEYRPKTANGTDNFNNGHVLPGILVYRVGGEGTGVDTSLMNGQDGNNLNGSRTYINAGTTEPFKVNDADGELLFCIIPSNLTEASVDITIHDGSDCPDDQIKDYVFEKTVDFSVNSNLFYGYSTNDIDVDKNGNIYTINSFSKEIVKSDSQGNLLQFINVPFDMVGQKVTADNQGNMYVGVLQRLGQYETTPWLLKYDKEGKEIGRWGPGNFRSIANGISHDSVVDIAVDSRGTVYVLYDKYTSPAWSDYQVYTIFKLDNSFKEVAKWSLPEKYIYTSMTLDPNNTIHAFGIGKWNGALSGWNEEPYNCIVSYSTNGEKRADWCKSNLQSTPIDSSHDGFPYLTHLEVDKDGNYLLLPQVSAFSIDMFRGNHSYVGKIGQEQSAFGGIKLAPDGKLYAVSRVQPLIRVFAPNKQPITYRTLSN